MSRAFLAVAFAASLAMPAAACAAESPFVGNWKLNPEKSPLAHDTLSFKAARRGRIRAVVAHQAYAFRTDGKNYQGPFGYRVAWTKLDERRWRVQWKLKKTVVATETLELAPGGKTLTSTTTRERVDGPASTEAVVFERTSGEADGLLGTWRSTKVAIAGLTAFEVAPLPKGLALTLVDSGAKARVTLDGADHPLTGPRTPPHVTVSLRPTGDRTLTLIEKQDLVPIFVGTLSVSEDARSLTWTWKPALVDEPITAVFDRM